MRRTVFGMSATLKSQMTSENSDRRVIIWGPSDRTSGQFIFTASTMPATDSATLKAFSPSVSSSARTSLLSFLMDDGTNHERY